MYRQFKTVDEAYVLLGREVTVEGDGLSLGDIVINNNPNLPEYTVVTDIVTGGPGGGSVSVTGYEYRLPRRTDHDIVLA